ncbi:MAG: glucose-6-phosphate dehydrogenase, partial [Limisphaerales bacterium]
MTESDQLDELMGCRIDDGRKVVEPCTVVIFGASGDLTARKLIPALYHLFVGKQLPSPVRIIGFARREKTDEQWRTELRTALDQFSRTKPVDEGAWKEFAQNISYCIGDFSDAKAFDTLKEQLAKFKDEKLQKNLLFYLATPPSQFAEVVEHLHNAGLLKRDNGGFWQRLVVEKPFGHDLQSAEKLNDELTRYAHEKQVYRID